MMNHYNDKSYVLISGKKDIFITYSCWFLSLLVHKYNDQDKTGVRLSKFYIFIENFSERANSQKILCADSIRMIISAHFVAAV